MTADRLWGGRDPEHQRECRNSEAVNIWLCLQRLLHQICSWTQMTWMLSVSVLSTETAWGSWTHLVWSHGLQSVHPAMFLSQILQMMSPQPVWLMALCVCVSVCDDDVFFFFKRPRLLMASHRTVVSSNVHQLHDYLWLKIDYSHLISVPTTPLDNSPL